MNNFFDANFYTTQELDRADAKQMSRYMGILRQSYEALGFFKSSVMPGSATRCFGLYFKENIVGILGLEEAKITELKPYFEYLPNIGRPPKLLEATNVVLIPEFRGGVGIGVLLREAALQAIKGGFDYIVGITRYQTLRYFVEFGLVPVDHPPLHLMEREDVDDWIVYYRTSDESAASYLRERSERYFHQQKTMYAIRERRKRPGGLRKMAAREGAF
ncbi:hypothetical protein ACSC9U_24145 [Pseudomonas solani]|uniref:hypothetical protein n=1 Tax=Pseudomonas solani TaxID=2731552 RepID=UPI003F4AA804